ncbi:MAG: GNAT family N-acetyltransferase [Candidatus Bathyarchaeota archaeon]
MNIRVLNRSEIENIRNLDRREIVKQVYYLDNGQLKLKNKFCNIKTWKADELERNIEHIYEIYDRRGCILGGFVDDKLIAVSALDSEFFGKNQDYLQLYFLHVDSRYRGLGFGKQLLKKTIIKAKELGARKLYISATPSQKTINFYFQMGCELAAEVNPRLLELEPKDIHLQLPLQRTQKLYSSR